MGRMCKKWVVRTGALYLEATKSGFAWTCLPAFSTKFDSLERAVAFAAEWVGGEYEVVSVLC